MRRIITVANLRLKTNNSSKGDDMLTTSVELTASAYSLNASSSPTPAPAGQAPAATPAAGKKEGEANARKSS